MLDLANIENIHFNQINDEFYDIGIFASGFESRSSFLAKRLIPGKIRFRIIIGFLEYIDDDVRKGNDSFYVQNYGEIINCTSQDEKSIYSKLISVFSFLSDQKEIKILIDYTSMARIWYSGILNFIRFQSVSKIFVFINYCPGIYNETFLDFNYSSINSIPFHEGSLSSNSKTLLVLGIGFSPYVIKSVIEEIEPNYTIGVLPLSVHESYQLISNNIRDNILANDIDEWIHCPINDLEYIFSTYADVCNNSLSSRDILFLSLGPKIFALASVLVGQRFKQVTCLYLKSSKNSKKDILPSGEFICNKITYCS